MAGHNGKLARRNGRKLVNHDYSTSKDCWRLHAFQEPRFSRTDNVRAPASAESKRLIRWTAVCFLSSCSKVHSQRTHLWRESQFRPSNESAKNSIKPTDRLHVFCGDKVAIKVHACPPFSNNKIVDTSDECDAIFFPEQPASASPATAVGNCAFGSCRVRPAALDWPSRTCAIWRCADHSAGSCPAACDRWSAARSWLAAVERRERRRCARLWPEGQEVGACALEHDLNMESSSSDFYCTVLMRL